MIILRVQDAVEQCVEILEDKYESINSICERPLFYDSQEVRQVLNDIKSARDTMINVADSLTGDFKPGDQDELE